MNTSSKRLVSSHAGLAVLSLLVASAATAMAQDVKKPIEVKLTSSQVTPIRVPMHAEAQWTDDEAKAVGTMLHGSWKSVAPIKTPDVPAGTEVVLGIAPVYVLGMKDVIYVEMARADGLNRPYRHLLWHLSKSRGVWHLQSFEFRRPGGTLPSAVGLWTQPFDFPVCTMDDLVATMDIPLKSEGGKLTGTTPVAYATSVGGAVEMTSTVTFSADRIEFADRGFDASGKQVWGPAEHESYAFAKADLGIKSTKDDRGLVTIDYPSQLSGDVAKDGDLVTVNYAGYLENGTVFDSSYERNQPFQYAKGTKLIDGWTTAMADARAGVKRRLVVPASLAYGERGSRGKVPPFATLIFDLEVIKVEPAPAAEPAPAKEAASPTVNSTPGGPKFTPAEPPPEIKAKMEADMRRRMEERAKKEAEQAAQPAPAAPK